MDLWPYINGKALVNKIKLMEMEASDMLDVIHYFLDEDLRYITAEEMTMHSSIRTTIFSNFYGIPYRYGSSDDKRETNSDAVKPYIPPTDLDLDSNDPFGGLLDTPLK